jgi:aryl-alcohol dehydrogenase-like predicted oxidoreductase
LQQGILLDKFDPENPPQFEDGDIRKTNPRFQPENLRPLKPRLARLKARFGATTEDLAAVALRYVLNHPNVACVIPGFRNERQVACNLGGAGRQLSMDDMAFIDETFGA